MSHTPRPWTVTSGWSQGTGDCYTINEAPGFAFDDKGEIEGNRLLIASAPELLEALIHLANEASGFKSMADPFTHGHTNMAVLGLRIDEAKAAIDKAEGRKP